MDKKALLRRLNESLALEQALIEAEGAMGASAKDPDLRQVTANAMRDDEGHLAQMRRVILDLGGRVEPPPMDSVAWIEALVRNINATDEVLDRIGLLRMMKARAVATGEVLDRIRFTLGNPPEMEPLVPMLRQDREHAQSLARLEARLVSTEIFL